MVVFSFVATCVLCVVKGVLAKFPTVRIPSIADDMTVTGPQLDAVAAFELKVRLKEVGLEMSPPKCKASCATELRPETRRRLEAAGLSDSNGSFPTDGFVLCGVPVGIDVCAAHGDPVAYAQAGVSAVVDKHRKTVDQIKKLGNPQGCQKAR